MTHLNVAHNQLSGLPESTRRCLVLKELFIQSNEINVLPSHGDPSGPGKFPSGSGPTALTVKEAAAKVRASERAAEELQEKIKKADSAREIMYWLGRIQEEVIRGAMDGLTLDWLDGIATFLGRHRSTPTLEQMEAKQKIVDNKVLYQEIQGMNASLLKKELRKRKLDASYQGSRRELIQRLEKFIVDDNKNNVAIQRGLWMTDVELKYLEVLALIDPHLVKTMKFWIWNAVDLRNADGKYSMSDPYVRVVMVAPHALDRELVRSRTIRNTLDPNWCDVMECEIDRRIDLSKCVLRFEVWDWDYGGDDVDDLLGQITFQASSQPAEEAEDAAKDAAKEAEVAAQETNNFLLMEFLKQGRDGKSDQDYANEENAQIQQENEQRHQDLLYKIEHPHGTAHQGNRDTDGGGEEVAVLKNVFVQGPSFLQIRKLAPLPKDVTTEQPGGGKKKKKAKSITIKGSLTVGCRIEPSKASKAATQMLLEEQQAAASAFELWPMLYEANMSHNRLMQLPRGVRGWSKLRRLNLAGNTLSVLPTELCKCNHLENLYLNDNQLVSLPLDFGHISKLRSLRLDRNKLTEIPESTYTITTLTQLNLADNPLVPVDGVKLWEHGTFGRWWLLVVVVVCFCEIIKIKALMILLLLLLLLLLFLFCNR